MVQARALCIAVTLAGCGGADVEHTLVDRGEVCLSSSLDPIAPGAGTFTAGAPIYVQFDAGVCTSAGCNRDLMAECQVTRTADVVAITTRGSWVDTSASADGCGANCGLIRASCEAGPLPSGTYTVRYNTKVLTLEVPSQLAATPCLRMGG